MSLDATHKQLKNQQTTKAVYLLRNCFQFNAKNAQSIIWYSDDDSMKIFVHVPQCIVIIYAKQITSAFSNQLLLFSLNYHLHLFFRPSYTSLFSPNPLLSLSLSPFSVPNSFINWRSGSRVLGKTLCNSYGSPRDKRTDDLDHTALIQWSRFHPFMACAKKFIATLGHEWRIHECEHLFCFIASLVPHRTQ